MKTILLGFSLMLAASCAHYGGKKACCKKDHKGMKQACCKDKNCTGDQCKVKKDAKES